jgi:hypothetical protein
VAVVVELPDFSGGTEAEAVEKAASMCSSEMDASPALVTARNKVKWASTVAQTDLATWRFWRGAGVHRGMKNCRAWLGVELGDKSRSRPTPPNLILMGLCGEVKEPER